MFFLAVPLAPARSADRLVPLDLDQIELGGLIGRRIQITVDNNLLVLDVDKDFLLPFQKRDARTSYIGLGKLIDSLARFSTYTADQRVSARKKHVVDAIIKTQEPDGYIGLFPPDKRMWQLWDVHEMSYLVYGLTSDYQLSGNKPSLDAARRLADYIIARWSAEPEKKPGGDTLTVHMAVTGLERAMLALNRQTGDRRYLDFCLKHRMLPDWNLPIVLGRWGRIEGHAYAYFAHCLAQLELNRMEPDEKLLGPTRRAMSFLTRQDGLVITGACGDHECWHDTQQGTINLGETCATAYLIRVLDALLRLEGDSRHGDVMERAIYNTLFAAQSPDGRRIRYYTPFDGPRAYFKGDTYCCPNNFRRIIADLPAMVVYRSGGGVAVNLYTPSTAKLQLNDGVSLTLRQETDYPNSGRVVIHVGPSKPVEFPLSLRIPSWCPKATIAVNGERIGKPIPGGSFFPINRQWTPGSRVQLDMPMAWRLVKGRKAQAGRVAVMRGPLVFCLNPAKNDKLAGVDLRLLTVDPESLEGPIPSDAVRPDGLACRIRAWGPGRWYPMAKTDLELVLTEFADPDGQAAYFHVPNPNAELFVEDELVRP